ncbi:MAG: hypothetical protein WBC44_12605 [Planctomycetaceae bacterium]
MSPQSASTSSEPSHLAFQRFAFVLIAVTAAVHAAALLNATPLQSANDRSRWSTVWSLVERGTFVIDAIDADPEWSTIDKVQHDGHLYSTKPALLTVLASGVYAVIRSTLGWSIYGDTPAVTRLVLAVINLLPWLGATAALASIAMRYGRTTFSRCYLISATAFGTYLSTYSTTFNNHTVAAVSLVFALYFALRIFDGSRRWWDFAFCGLTSAFVTTNELPAAAFGLAMFAVLLRTDWRRTLFVFVPAALVPIAAFLVTTWMQTGSWKPFYMAYGTSKYVYIREGLPSYWATPKGIDRNLDSPIVYLLHCTIGHHGILSLSPIFLLTIATWLRMRRRPAEPYRPLLWMGLALTALILAFYLSRTENYNYGGNTVALRWALWLIPFWLIALLPTLDDFADRRWFRCVAVGLLAVSTFSAWEAIANPWRPSWLYALMDSARWIDYSDHEPPLQRRLTTWFPKIPASGIDPADQWIEMTATTEQGTELIRLELVEGDANRPQLRVRQFETVAGRRREIGDVTATIDREQFDAGARPIEFVVSGKPSVAEAIGALQRLPKSVEYRPGPVRYQKLPARELAFRTQLVTATIDVRRRSGNVLRHRIDAWLCDDVPFGVVRIRETLTDARTGDWISRRDYQLTDAGFRKVPDWATAIRELK